MSIVEAAELPTELRVYAKMLKFGVPWIAVKNKMLSNGIDEWMWSKYFADYHRITGDTFIDWMSIDKPHAASSKQEVSVKSMDTEKVLSSLINIMELSQQLTTDQHIKLLQEFIRQFTPSILMRIMFKGLYAMNNNKNQTEYIEFFVDHITSILSQNEESKYNQVSMQFNIVDLHLDSFTYICQFLEFNELLHLEQCNRYLYQVIRDNPQCVTSLNLQDCNNEYNRTFSFVRKLSYQSNFQSAPLPIIVQNMLPNIVELSINEYPGDLDRYSDRLQSLKTLNLKATSMVSINQIISRLSCCLTELNVSINNEIRYDVSAKDLFKSLFQMKNLEKLAIAPNGNSYGPKLWENTYNNSLFWKTLTEFKVNGYHCIQQCFPDTWYTFIQYVLQKCNNLKVLQFISMSKYHYDHIFGHANNTFDNVEELVLEITSTKIGEVYRNIAESKAILQKLHLKVWDEDILFRFAFSNNEASNILNNLKLLLESQLFQHNQLNDLKFIFNVYHHSSNPILRFYSMLISIFRSNKTKYFNKMNISFDTQLCNKLCLPCAYAPNLIAALLNAVNKKVNHCFINLFNFDENILTFSEEMNLNNDWIVPLTDAVGISMITIMKPTDYGIYMSISIQSSFRTSVAENSEINHSCLEELRWNQEQIEITTEDKEVIGNDGAEYPLNGLKFIMLHKNEIDYKENVDVTINNFETQNAMNVEEIISPRNDNIDWKKIVYVLLFHYPLIANWNMYNATVTKSNECAKIFVESLTDFNSFIVSIKKHLYPSKITKTGNQDTTGMGLSTIPSSMRTSMLLLLDEEMLSDTDVTWDSDD